MKNSLKIIFVLIGTMIGAGFASGKEVYIFFNQYGIYGIIGIIISSVFTGYIIYKVFHIIQNKPEKNYEEFLNLLTGIGKNTKINLTKIMNFIINSFLLISFYIMIAGFSAYFEQDFNIPRWCGSLVILVFSYITFLGNIDRIMKVNTILIPILMLFIIHIGVKNVDYVIENYSKIEINSGNFLEWLISSILYGSYNSILLIPMILSLGKYIKNKKQNIIISVCCIIILSILGLIIYSLLLRTNQITSTLDLPMLAISSEFGEIYHWLYAIIIVISIFTSAIAAGYGFLENCCKTKKSYNVILTLMCISGLIVSHFGFSSLVSTLYPFFGILGLLQTFFIFRKNVEIKNDFKLLQKSSKTGIK